MSFSLRYSVGLQGRCAGTHCVSSFPVFTDGSLPLMTRLSPPRLTELGMDFMKVQVLGRFMASFVCGYNAPTN